MVSRFPAGERRVLLALLFTQLFAAGSALALPNDAAVPILLYHSSHAGYHRTDPGDSRQEQCGYSYVATTALREDLNEIYAQGFTVVPVRWIVEWALGQRDGSTLPDKVIGITIDDGYDLDWRSESPNVPRYPSWCPETTSIQAELTSFKQSHPGLPSYSPHVSSFVIASPVARAAISTVNGYQYANDDWWATAQASGLMGIYDHSADHDGDYINTRQYDPALGIHIPVRSNLPPNHPALRAGPSGCAPVAGESDSSDSTKHDFCYVGTDTATNTTATHQVVKSAEYIQSKTGVWPDLFAFPFGHISPQVLAWFENNPAQHRMLAAFGGTPVPVRRGSPRYALGRYTHGAQWHTQAEFKALLESFQPAPTAAWSVDGVPMAPGQAINVTVGQPLTLAYTSTNTDRCEAWVTQGYGFYPQLWPPPPTKHQSGPAYTFAPQPVEAPGVYNWHVKCYSPYGGRTVETWFRGIATAPAPTATWYINGTPMYAGSAFVIYAGQYFGLRFDSTGTQRCEHWVTAGEYFYPELWRAPPGHPANLPSFDYGYVSVDAPGVYNWHITCFSAGDASSVSTWVRGYVY
ncbi:hypothetical protein JY651_40590 [Pyxidicoccus parkwayensis]|uniref:Uncharacterized protein n=1 Tax=Pyxidicoccus parkwayensis TaxID=2813578 RepID=A0ABX7NVJ9_9BACT|nr:hypothetical protein [Pyxidicoccus parkwaysis]QSQ21424.1 hypothetical protein JY651_40590 [Pyxidicoccus parkwaysis]